MIRTIISCAITVAAKVLMLVVAILCALCAVLLWMATRIAPKKKVRKR